MYPPRKSAADYAARLCRSLHTTAQAVYLNAHPGDFGDADRFGWDIQMRAEGEAFNRFIQLHADHDHIPGMYGEVCKLPDPSDPNRFIYQRAEELHP